VEWLARVSEEENGVDGEEDSRELAGAGKEVSSGESVGRVARGDSGRPVGLGCVDDCILGLCVEVELTKLGGCRTGEVLKTVVAQV
jgi:hypothetical protein